MTWYVDDLATEMSALRSLGVSFEEYDTALNCTLAIKAQNLMRWDDLLVVPYSHYDRALMAV